MFERIEPQGPLRFREFFQALRVGVVVGGKQLPKHFEMKLHQRVQRACDADRRKQTDRADAQNARLDRQGLSIRCKSAKNHEIGVHILRDAQHRSPAQACRRRQPGAIQFFRAPLVRIHLLSGRGEPLNRQFLQPLAQPVQAWGSAIIIERENQINPLLDCVGCTFRSPRRSFQVRRGSGRQIRKSLSSKSAGRYSGGRDRPIEHQQTRREKISFHACIIVAEALNCTGHKRQKSDDLDTGPARKRKEDNQLAFPMFSKKRSAGR